MFGRIAPAPREFMVCHEHGCMRMCTWHKVVQCASTRRGCSWTLIQAPSSRASRLVMDVTDALPLPLHAQVRGASLTDDLPALGTDAAAARLAAAATAGPGPGSSGTTAGGTGGGTGTGAGRGAAGAGRGGAGAGGGGGRGGGSGLPSVDRSVESFAEQLQYKLEMLGVPAAPHNHLRQPPTALGAATAGGGGWGGGTNGHSGGWQYGAGGPAWVAGSEACRQGVAWRVALPATAVRFAPNAGPPTPPAATRATGTAKSAAGASGAGAGTAAVGGGKAAAGAGGAPMPAGGGVGKGAASGPATLPAGAAIAPEARAGAANAPRSALLASSASASKRLLKKWFRQVGGCWEVAVFCVGLWKK